MRSKEAVDFAEALLALGGKKSFLTGTGNRALIDLCAETNAKPYEMPFDANVKSPLSERDAFGMHIYTLCDDIKDDGTPVILYLHGGCYWKNPMNLHWWLVDRLSRELNCKLLMPIYPLAPHQNWKDCFESVMGLYEELLEKYGNKRIIFMGDSAGGGFAIAMAQELKKQGKPLPAALYLFSPWVNLKIDSSITDDNFKEICPDIYIEGVNTVTPDDLTAVDPMIATYGLRHLGKLWADGLPLDDPRVSPLFGDVTGLPPIVYYTGTYEILWPDARAFYDKCKANGVDIDYNEWPEMNHVFVGYPIPEGTKAQDEVIAKIKKQFNL